MDKCKISNRNQDKDQISHIDEVLQGTDKCGRGQHEWNDILCLVALLGMIIVDLHGVYQPLLADQYT